MGGKSCFDNTKKKSHSKQGWLEMFNFAKQHTQGEEMGRRQNANNRLSHHIPWHAYTNPHNMRFTSVTRKKFTVGILRTGELRVKSTPLQYLQSYTIQVHLLFSSLHTYEAKYNLPWEGVKVEVDKTLTVQKTCILPVVLRAKSKVLFVCRKS